MNFVPVSISEIDSQAVEKRHHWRLLYNNFISGHRNRIYHFLNLQIVKTELTRKNRKHLNQNIINPVNPDLIRSELKQLGSRYFLFSQGVYSIYCAPFHFIPNLMLEIGRLREITFREVGEGTGKSIDLDNYDLHFNHLVIWDDSKNQLVGSYRIGKGKDIMTQYGKSGFYISSLFRIKKGFNSVLAESLELGRSFIVREYQRQTFSLLVLWKGIFLYLLKNPEYKYLIGPVSISNDFSDQSKSLIVEYIKKNYFNYPLSLYIKSRNEFKAQESILNQTEDILACMDKNLKALDLCIKDLQPVLNLPVLLKKYLQINGMVIGFNIDPDFNNCLDALMLVKIADVPVEMIDNLSRQHVDYRLRRSVENICLT